MRNLYRIAQGADFSAAMVSVMRQPDAFKIGVHGLREVPLRGNAEGKYPHFYPTASTFGRLRELSIAMLALAQGSALGRVSIFRVDPKSSLKVWSSSGCEAYLIVLHSTAKGLVMSGDEAVPIITGDTWWVGTAGADVMNNGDDDLVVLVVEVSDK